MPINWAAIIGYIHVSKGQIISLQWCDFTSSGDGSTSPGDGSTIRTASNTIKWYDIKIVFHLKLITDTCTKHQIETQNLGFKQTPSQGGVGGPNILLILAPTCFLLNNLWSVCRYIMGPFSSWRSLCRKGKPPHLKKYVRNRCSPIQISNRFISKLHILHKSDNIVH